MQKMRQRVLKTAEDYKIECEKRDRELAEKEAKFAKKKGHDVEAERRSSKEGFEEYRRKSLTGLKSVQTGELKKSAPQAPQAGLIGGRKNTRRGKVAPGQNAGRRVQSMAAEEGLGATARAKLGIESFAVIGDRQAAMGRLAE